MPPPKSAFLQKRFWDPDVSADDLENAINVTWTWLL